MPPQAMRCVHVKEVLAHDSRIVGPQPHYPFALVRREEHSMQPGDVVATGRKVTPIGSSAEQGST